MNSEGEFMTVLTDTITRIQSLHEDVMEETRTRWRQGLQSTYLGVMENMVTQVAGITGIVIPPIMKKCMILAVADHGVACRGISAYPVATTVQMTKNYLISQGAGANALAKYCSADIVVVDVGINADMSAVPGLVQRKIANGTKDFTLGPAMSRDEAILAILIGIELVSEKINDGYGVFSVGEMGIGNTTSSAAMTAVFCGLTPEEATGRGTNISDKRLQKKVDIVRAAVAKNTPDRTDGIGVMAALGGFELATLTGVMLGAAARQRLVIIDGFNAAAAALAAQRISRNSIAYLMASHLSAERAHARALKELGLVSSIDLGFRLGEASGASIQMKILDSALSIFQNLQIKKG